MKRYKIIENNDHIGYLNVEYEVGVDRYITADLFKKSESFMLLHDKNGHVNEKMMKLWIEERIVPRTRIGIEDNLKQMGLTEYDELAILKFTKGRKVTDKCYIDFNEL